VGKIHQLAVGEEGDPDHEWLEQQWQETLEKECYTEPKGVTAEGLLPQALPACSRAIAQRIQTSILRQDLRMLATAIRGGPENDCPKGSQSWLQNYQASIDSGTGDSLNASTLWNLWNEAASVGSQRIKEDIGTDTFA
jgi:hypothetical protein